MRSISSIFYKSLLYEIAIRNFLVISVCIYLFWQKKICWKTVLNCRWYWLQELILPTFIPTLNFKYLHFQIYNGIFGKHIIWLKSLGQKYHKFGLFSGENGRLHKWKLHSVAQVGEFDRWDVNSSLGIVAEPQNIKKKINHNAKICVCQYFDSLAVIWYFTSSYNGTYVKTWNMTIAENCAELCDYGIQLEYLFQ